jgi:hypothetical protein
MALQPVHYNPQAFGKFKINSKRCTTAEFIFTKGYSVASLLAYLVCIESK